MNADDDSLSPGSRIVWHAVVPAVVGTATGAAVAGFLYFIEGWMLAGLVSLPSIVPGLFAPVGLVLTYFAARFVTRTFEPTTSELYIVNYHHGAETPLEQTPGRILATVATVGFGGSQGFESTSALTGSTFADLIARIRGFGLSPATRQTLRTAGASAGIAAVFSSPGAGTLYGMEIPFRNGVDARRLVPCAIASVSAFAVRTWLIGDLRIIQVAGEPELTGTFVLACLMVAVAAGLGARLFAAIADRLRRLGKGQPRIARALIGGGVLSLLAIAGVWLTGAWITFGSGYVATAWLQSASRSAPFVLLVLLVRGAGNLATVYGGGGGGVFTSLACNGAFIGQAIALALGCDTTHALALFGAACFLGAGYRIPLAAMLFVGEAGLGVGAAALGIAAVGIAYLVMGNASVSEEQRNQRGAV